MQKITLLILFLSILTSCYRNAREPEFDMSLVLPADTMVSLLTDLHLADAMVNIEQMRDKPLEHISGEYFHTVMEKHHTQYAAFEESIRYYAFHTEELNKIYEKVVINLSVMESRTGRK